MSRNYKWLCVIFLLSGCSAFSIEKREGELPRLLIESKWCDKLRAKGGKGELEFTCTRKV